MKYTKTTERNGYIVIGIATAIAIAVILLTGCANTSMIVGVDHTSHLLQHFEHESDYGMIGCTGPMAGFRYSKDHVFVQATEKYCVNGLTDREREVADVQIGYLIPLQ